MKKILDLHVSSWTNDTVFFQALFEALEYSVQIYGVLAILMQWGTCNLIIST